MSTEENKDLVRRLFAAINRRSLDELDDLLGPDFRLNGEPVGLADFKEFVNWHVSVLADVRFAIEDLVAEGDEVVARLLRAPIKVGSTWNLRASPRARAASTSSVSLRAN